MENLWTSNAAGTIPADSVALGVRIARLLGQADLASSGCSVSVKVTEDDFFGDPVDLCYVSPEASDLDTLDQDDFVPLRRSTLVRLSECRGLSDVDWLEQVRAARHLAGAPDPCTDAMLHAVLPQRFVIVVEADAILALTNRPDGEAEVRRVLGDRVLFVDYARPGFALAQAVAHATRDADLSRIDGLILAGLGLVTFDDDAQRAYDLAVELVTLGEASVAVDTTEAPVTAPDDLRLLAALRTAVARARGHALVTNLDASPEAVAFSARENIDVLAARGPRTPRRPLRVAVVDDDFASGLARFGAGYAAYFLRHAGSDHTMRAAAPDFVVWKNRGVVSFGDSPEQAQDVADAARHTYDTILCVESQSTWTPVAESAVFAAEYQQFPQPQITQPRIHDGKVAVVTGAAAGIGFACARALTEAGATVIGLDIHPDIIESMGGLGGLGLQADLTDDEQIRSALDAVVRTYGGLDILVSNAGIFTAGSHLEDLEPGDWDRSLAVNLTSHQRLLKRAIPYLERGLEAAIVLMASRNVNAPGAGAASYSCAKAALTQLGRIAALELAPRGVRVNIVHPDAVFDTKLWTPEALQRSADRYGMTVAEYKARNLMKTEIRSENVGMLVSAVAGPAFAKTTGAQIPIDGGNDRII